MKHVVALAFLSLLLFAAGCTSEGKREEDKKSALADSSMQQIPPLQGNMKREYTLIPGDSGAAKADWQLSADYVYDDTGHEISVVGYGANRQSIKAQYDSAGYEILRVVESVGATGSMEYRSVWNADHSQQTTEVFSAVDSRVVQKVTNQFNANGTLIASEEEDRRFLEAISQFKMRMELDAKGRVSKQFESFDGKEILGVKYSYNEAGDPIMIERMDNEGNPSQTEYFEYNPSGKKTAVYLQDFSAYFKTKQLKSKFEYDPFGRLAKEVHYKGLCDEAGFAAGKCTVYETVVYSYDPEGRIATKEYDRSGSNQKGMKLRYEYSGNVPAR